MITAQHLEEIYEVKSSVFPSYLEPLEKTFAEFNINTVNRKAGFLSQIGVESSLLTRVIENLNYSAPGLIATFPHVFNKYNAATYEHKPEKIANLAYANRLGNGGEPTGDGWKYRGMGLIQLTGKDLHSLFAAYIKMPLDNVQDYLQTKEGAARSAGWYWNYRAINQYADADNIEQITAHVNAAKLALASRTKYYNKAKLVLA